MSGCRTYAESWPDAGKVNKESRQKAATMGKRAAAHELISLAEASRRYGLSGDYLRTIARKGRLKAQKIGRDWLTTPYDVEAYLGSRKKKGAYRDDLGT
jgi:hypothetical protein